MKSINSGHWQAAIPSDYAICCALRLPIPSFSITCTATSVYDGPCVLEHAYAYNLETMEGSRTDRGTFDPVPDKEN